MAFDVKTVARLARLALREEQLAQFEEEMQAIVDMASQLPAREDEAEDLPGAQSAVLREDTVTPSLAQGEVLQNAPQSRDGFFEGPKTLG